MITIGKIPRKVQRFFRPLEHYFSRPAWSHFCGLVLAMAVGRRSTIARLSELLRNATHRTNHGEFLWRSVWDETLVMQHIAMDLLMSLWRGGKDNSCYLILDDTQTLKRAKRMEAVGKLFHHATGKYGMGHTIFKACLWCRGVTIPFGSWLYVKKGDAKKVGVEFAKLTELAAQTIRRAPLPSDGNVKVLFDSYYLCSLVASACRDRGWRFISVGKANRNFTVRGQRHKLASYGKNVLRRGGRWHSITGLRKTHRYRLASRVGTMKGLGEVKVVFSRRQKDRSIVALVTDDRRASDKTIVADYLKRWAIELLIKDEKQQLGLGDYRVLRYAGVVRHLHLVDCAHACLTHLALRDQRAQGQSKKKNTVLRLPTIRQLKSRLQQEVWREAVQDVIKFSHEKPVLRRLEKLLAA